MKTANYLNNQLLIAMPRMTDPNFHRSVTFICEHNENGAIGIIINRPLHLSLDHVFSQMDIFAQSELVKNIPLVFGGPLQQDRGFILHQPAGRWRSSLILQNDIAVTTSQDLLESIAEESGPKDVLIALGYAGWGPQQLENELAENVWLTCPMNSDIIFRTPFADRWKNAALQIGVNIDYLSDEIGHA